MGHEHVGWAWVSGPGPEAIYVVCSCGAATIFQYLGSDFGHLYIQVRWQ